MLGFCLAVALPLLTLLAGAVWMYHAANRSAAEDRLLAQAHAMALLLDREFTEAERTLQTLSSAQALARGDLDGFLQDLRSAATVSQSEAISLADAGGRVLLSTLWPSATPPAEVFATAHARNALASGHRSISNLYLSPTTRRHAISVVLPFDLANPAPQRYLLAFLLPREHLLAGLVQQRLPPGGYASILDRDQVIVARTLRDAPTTGMPSRPDVAATLTSDQGIARFTSLEGTPVVSAHAKAPSSGYWVRLSIPEAIFLAPLQQALLRAGAVGLGLLGVSLALALVLGRRMAASLRSLTPNGAGGAFVAPGFSGLPEVDELAAALARASEQRDRALAELQLLHSSSPVGMAHTDTGGRVTSANDAFLRLLGRTATDLAAGKVRWDEVTPPEFAARDEAAIAEAVDWGYCRPYEKEFLHPDGRRVPVLVAFGLLDRATGRCAAFAVDLSDRRQAEAALAESQARLLMAKEAGGIGLWDLDIASGEVSATSIWFALHAPGAGADAGHSRLDRWLGAIVAADRDRVSAEISTAAAGGVLRTEYRVASTADGPIRRVEALARRTPSGEHFRLVGTVRDVTKQRAAQEALQRRHDTLQALVSSDVIGITVCEGTVIEEANDHFLRMVGHSRAELEAGLIDWAALTPPEHRAADAAMVRHMTETGTSYAYETEYQRPDGNRVPVLIGAGLIDPGTLRRIVFVVDLTERKRAEAVAQAADTMLGTILDATTDRMSVLDAAGRFLFVNRAGLEHLGADNTDTLRGQSWHELWPAGQSALVQEAVQAAAAGRATRFSGMMPNTRGEPLWWDIAVTPILGTNGQPHRILVVARDITAGHAAEDMMHQINLRLEVTVAERTQALSETASELAAELQRREEAQAALLQAQKLEALGQLTSGVAHDFNNMLAAIQGSFTLLTKRAHDETAQKLIRNGRQASDRAAALIRHLLAFARREELQPVVVDPAGLLPGVGELVRQSVGRRVTLVMESVPADTWRVLVEAHQLEVALLNLAVNARDAMPEGGVLTISARNMPAAEQRPPGVPAGDCVALQVRDTGTGMSPEVLARATEAFFTTKDKGQGTGLGLAMVQRMAQQLGGTLHIDSTLGLGTTMSIILPRADLRLAPLPSASTGIDPTLHGNAALLVVDDDEQVRMVTAGFLRDLGYTVIEAANAQAAYALALAADAVDLVVSDVAMPGADGPSLAARLRLEWPDLPIIFVTGFAGDAALAGETVLAKPYAFPDLAQLVAERLGRGDDSRQQPG